MTLAIPTVHLNGTSPDELLAQCANACEGVRNAILLLGQAAPNGRDYYTQGGDTAHPYPVAFAVASTQHRQRIAKLQAVYDEIELIAEGVAEQAARRTAHRAA